MFHFGKKKPILVTIHGFGKRVHHEFDPFQSYFSKLGYTVIQFDMFDVDDPNDADYKAWIARCESKMREVMSQKRDVILIGFSMGGVIASYLASIYRVKKLFLFAPAFQYLDVGKIAQYGIQTVKKIYANDMEMKMKPSIKQTSCFQDIVRMYKDSIDMVDCPVYLFHGTADEVIPVDSSKNAYKRVSHPDKLLLFIEDGKHRMLYDNTFQDKIFPIVQALL